MQLYPGSARPQTYFCPSLNIFTPSISFFASFSSFAHGAVLAQHIAMTTSTISSVPKLCDNCQRINLSMFLPWAGLKAADGSGCYGGENRTIKAYVREPDGSLIDEGLRPNDVYGGLYQLDLGPLEAIVARQKVCPLCHFITTMFKESYGRKISNLPAVLVVEGACKVYLTESDFGMIEIRDQSLPYKLRWSNSWRINCMELSCWSKGKRKNHMAFLAAPTSKSASEPTLLARNRPARCDITLFNSWLQICATSHSQCCRKPVNATVPLRLIDVLNMCLVTMNNRERAGVEYLALSYVWGEGPKEFVLKTENIQEYCRPRGIPILPKTISDAVTLTKKMVKKYLWVDSLCIVSNDPEDKASQIPAMTSVYGNAMLTIIAAAGEDANHGLPGLDSFRPGYKAVDLGRYQIVKSYLFQGQRSVQRTTWATRAWTYQEILLSTRCLIFLETHVEWLCSCTEWFEQLGFEHPNFDCKRRRILPEQQLRLDISNYGYFVQEYTRRNLTFETDIVNAFVGITAAIDDEFFWGIAYPRFCQSLAWEMQDILSTYFSDQRRNCGLSIPSWSWLSWRGVIDLNGFSQVRQSLLAVYRWRSGQLEQICTPEVTSLFERSYPLQAEVIWRDDSDWKVCIEDLPSDVTLNENQLIFWAPTGAMFSEYVLIGEGLYDDVVALSMTCSDKIATRLGRVTFKLEEWPVGNVLKKLIIME
jgi:hypothetical protein